MHPRHLISAALLLADLAAFNLAPWLAAGTVYLFAGDLDSYIPSHEIDSRLACYLILSVLCVSWFGLRLKHYTERRPFWFELKDIIRVLMIYAVFDLAIIAFSKWQLSRYLWLLTWVYMLALMPVLRELARALWRRTPYWQVKAVMIGDGPNAKEAFDTLSREQSLGYKFIGYVGPHTEDSSLHGLMPQIASERALFARRDFRYLHYFIATETQNHKKVREHWIKKLTSKRCHYVAVIPTTRGVPLNNLQPRFLFSHEILILNLNASLPRWSSRILKRLFDFFASAALILLLSPLLLLLAFQISRDGGSPIYGHERVGQYGRKFKCLKFRSMVKNSKEVLEQLLATDPNAKAEWDKDFKLKDDPRITRVGNFLRKTSLDELPQLFNVLAGQMSLVGPRPVIEEEVLRYKDSADYYLLAKPGMTGLWQVSGRNDVDYDQRVYFDAWYVKNWSLWNDICILFKTVRVVLQRDGAY